MNSFFSYARQLQTLREGIKTDEQKEIFDMEVNSMIEIDMNFFYLPVNAKNIRSIKCIFSF